MTEPAAGGPNVEVTHVGLCVSDLARSEHFYTEALGFRRVGDLSPPDDITGKLLRVPEPHATAVYLASGDFTLELLHFDREGNAPARERSITERGLTHLAMTVDDLAAALDLVRAHGGTVLDDTHVGVAVQVLDPDGQILELVARR